MNQLHEAARRHLLQRKKNLLKKGSDPMTAVCIHGRFLSTEIKEFFGGDFQHLAELEEYVKRYSDIAQLDRADVAAVNVHQFSQLELGEALAFAVENYIKAKLFILMLVSRFHTITTMFHCSDCMTYNKPCHNSVALLTQVKSDDRIDARCARRVIL